MVSLLVIGLFLLAVFDAGIVAMFVTNLIQKILGETPLSRLSKLIGGIASFGFYGYWAIYKTAEFWSSTTSDNISPIGMIIVLALPLVLIAILYVINGNSSNKE